MLRLESDVSVWEKEDLRINAGGQVVLNEYMSYSE
jgi:hypothetical protein